MVGAEYVCKGAEVNHVPDARGNPGFKSMPVRGIGRPKLTPVVVPLVGTPK